MKKYTFEIYRDKKKEYRWRLVASNGKVVGDSAEGYKRKASVLSVLNKLVDHTTNFIIKG